jgi:DHA1 family multidrug resistance protein-like MFS transporter
MNHSVNDGLVYLLSSLFPVVLTVFGLSVFQVGVLVGVGYLVSVVGQPLVGRYSEKTDSKKLLAFGIAVMSLSVFSFVLSTGFYSLLASVILLRAGSCFYHPVGVSAVSKSYTGTSLERAMGIQSAFGNLGIFLVFVSAAPIYLALGWKATFALFALVGAADVGVTLAIFKSPKPVDQPSQTEAEPQSRSRYRLGLPSFFLVTMFVSGASFAVVLNYANILLENEYHLGVFLANVAVSGWIALAFVGAISTGRWPRVMRRSVFLALVFFLSAATIMVLAFASSGLALAIPLLCVNGFTLSATYPLTYSELSDFLDNKPETKGRSFGVIFSAQTIGGSVFGLAAGYLSTAYGLPSAFFAAGLLMLLGSGMALAWTRRAGA